MNNKFTNFVKNVMNFGYINQQTIKSLTGESFLIKCGDEGCELNLTSFDLNNCGVGKCQNGHEWVIDWSCMR